MDKDFKLVKSVGIFRGLTDKEIKQSLKMFKAKYKKYKKGEFILLTGERVDNIKLIISGSVLIFNEDFWGNINIITKLFENSIFAEAFALSGSVSTVSVEALGDCTIMLLNVGELLDISHDTSGYQNKIIKNILADLSRKNIKSNEKITHMSRRSTKEKLLSFLSSEALINNSEEFDIAFNREQLADFLSVDRSAMSNELCKLRDDGVLEFKRNHFKLKSVDR